MSGADVWRQYNAGHIETIRNYCETDVLNTYLIYLRFQYIRGHLTPDSYELEIDRVRSTLVQDGRPHIADFLSEWSLPHDKPSQS